MLSNDGRLKTRKRISLGKQPEFRPKSKTPRLEKPFEYPPISNTPRGSFPAPRVQLSHKRIARAPKKKAIQCAGIALSSWNEKSLSEQGLEYELVDALGIIGMVGPTIYHFNFIARPKNESEAENKLFFAEVEYSEDYKKDGKDAALGCNVCCILGTSGTVTGLYGCEICELHPSLIQHPKNGEFTKGPEDARAKIMAKYGQQ